MEQRELIYKTCRTCQESKEILRYRPHALECKQCNNKKDAENHLQRTKIYYQKHKETIIKKNTDYYYKMKLLKETNLEAALCV